jgi:2-polyprenyl-3-methyl-5-hydroxy-6-metoxy-1,4-benzoquinol methylase
MTRLVRRREPELMDQPDLAPAAHDAALEGLERINRWSAAEAALRRPVLALAHRVRDEGGPPLTLLDVACGGGDVPIALWKDARRERVPLEVAAIDRSPQAVAHAQAAAARAGAAVRVWTRDACDGRPLPPADVVTCSLFLHHLEPETAVALLAALGAAAQRMLLVSDLRRTVTGLVLALAVPRLLSRSPVVHADAPASARAAWSPGELIALAERAGLAGAQVQRIFPQRMLLTWTR